MSDITKCVNSDCEIKGLCYRWLAPSGLRQSLAHFDPENNGNCRHFWEVSPRTITEGDRDEL